MKLCGAIKAAVRTHFPEFVPTTTDMKPGPLEMQYPHWSMVDPKKPEDVLTKWTWKKTGQ